MDFSFGNNIVIGKGKNGLEKIDLKSDWDKTSCEIYLHGACITSFKKNGKEMFYLSPTATYVKEVGKKIRGGVPICWPQFSTYGKVGRFHGFARESDEFYIGHSNVDKLKKEVTITLRLVDTEYTRKMWNNHFIFDYIVTLCKGGLMVEMKVRNCNSKRKFDFTTALHTYFKINDITETKLQGLKNVKYNDSLSGPVTPQKKILTETNENVIFDKEVDRIYLNTFEKEMRIISKDVNVSIKNEGFVDQVVWNPWIEKAKRTKDLPDEDYKKFCCVEVACAVKPIIVKANDVWTGRMFLQFK